MFFLTFHENFQEKSKNHKNIIKKEHKFSVAKHFFGKIGNLSSPRGIYDLFMFFLYDFSFFLEICFFF